MSNTVWITPNWRSKSDVFHTTKDCPRIKGDVEAVARDDVPHRRACKDQACTGEVSRQLQETDCPVCGATVRKQLALHLAKDCDGEDAGGASA